MRCSNYIWGINNFIAYQDAIYTRIVAVIKIVQLQKKREHIQWHIMCSAFVMKDQWFWQA